MLKTETTKDDMTPSTPSREQRCRCFSFAELRLATNNFDERWCIGRGGFGKVYRGLISDGPNTNIYAIKRLHFNSEQGAPEFWIEVKMLSKLRHCNLVSLIGYCNEGKEMALVYEYMHHGTLSDHLHKKGTRFNWSQRLKICLGAARGLDYLHTGTGTQHGIIHRDVKSSNILLDQNYAAKIGDFGLAKTGPINQTLTYVSTGVKGTFGYMDPNYFYTGRLTRKSDVYAFGVVLLEMLCGRPALDVSLDEGLAVWAQDRIKQGKLSQIIDSSLRDHILKSSLKEFSGIAVRCLLSHPNKRPTMSEVVSSLDLALSFQEKRNSSTQGGNIRTKVWSIFSLKGHIESKETNGIKETISETIGMLQVPTLVTDVEVDQTKPIQEQDANNYLLPEIENLQIFGDALPSVKDLQISGEAFPGRELLASGYSVNGTTSCNFEWVRHTEDGFVYYIGATQPNYIVTADDVDTYLAIEVQPVDDRKRKGKLVKAFANEHRKIVCSPEMHDHIKKALLARYAEHKLSLWTTGYLDVWEPVTLVIKKDGIKIKGSGTSVNEKYSATTTVSVPCGNRLEFSIIGLGSVERRLRVEQESEVISWRDIIVLTMRWFIKQAVEKKKGLLSK